MSKMQEQRKEFMAIANLFDKKVKFRLFLVTLIQVSLGLLDLVGVVAVGLLGSIATLGITSQTAGGWTAKLIELLGLERFDFQMQIAILGLSTALLLVVKTITSLYLSRKTIFYLSRRAAVISNSMMARLVNLNLTNFLKFRTNDLIYAFSVGISTLTMGVVAPFLAVIVDLSLLIILSTVLFITEPLLALLTLFFFISIAIILYINLSVRAKNLGSESAILFDDSIKNLKELIFTYRELLVRNNRQKYAARLGANRDRLAWILAELTFFPNLSKYALEIGLVIGAVSITGYQIIYSNSSRAIAILAIFIVASLRIGPAVLRIQQSLVAIKRAVGQSLPTLAILQEVYSNAEIQNAIVPFSNEHSNFNPKVVFENVSYSYENDSNKDVISNISFEIPRGEFWSIVGSSGVGKSTLVDLMVGAINPSAGEISISDLEPLSTFVKWPGSVAYVPQEIFLTEGSIKENVILGFDSDEIEESLIWNVLDSAQLGEFVRNLPSRLDFQVGENGRNISGGERQRLGIARALITNPKLIVLDEATSALDERTQSQISSTLASLKGTHTLVMIAHRIETLEKCDRIIVLKNDKSYQILEPKEFFAMRAAQEFFK